MKLYAVVMAGGGGTRFWPLSRQDLPKQFLNLTGDELMVNETIDRLTMLVPKENIFVVTSEKQAELMYESTAGRIGKDHILLEPAARNTAACIGFSAMEIIKKHGDGIMCVVPSDHYIKDVDAYIEKMREAVELCKKTDYLITIGIKPGFAATGYGYIKINRSREFHVEDNRIPYYNVEEFVEKPDIKTAKEYVSGGNYLWNSGMFIWKASTILAYFKKLLPDVYECIEDIGNSMNTDSEDNVKAKIYPTIPKISIDYGIMERAKEVLVLEGDFGWNDVGSFDALRSLYEADENGNVIYGEQIHVETQNCIVYSKNKLIAALGVEDLIIVETDDAVLVCHKDKAQEVRKVVDKLHAEGKDQYL